MHIYPAGGHGLSLANEETKRQDGSGIQPECQSWMELRMDVTVVKSGSNCAVKLKNVLIVVKDIEKAKKFYHDLFGLDVVLDQEGNVILTEGLVLQDEAIWKKYLGKEVVPKNNSCELYFEEKEIEDFAEKLEKQYPEIYYVNRLITHSWGQKVIRFYDLDGNLIEVGTPV